MVGEPGHEPGRPPERIRLVERVHDVAFDGVGPVDVGMTLEGARAASGLVMAYGEAGVCASYGTYGSPAGLHFTAVEGSGRLDFISVSAPAIATVSGIRVGSTLADVRRTYGDKLRGSVQDGWASSCSGPTTLPSTGSRWPSCSRRAGWPGCGPVSAPSSNATRCVPDRCQALGRSPGGGVDLVSAHMA